ncbi:Crp/Fnr family transcriptional regulator [Anaerolineales bacterium HSG6]|nr:Crp/Fnr family transcriptional regulator [Anaerolineales bacterium HSG6]MDM8530056.1 Crp/Fnr family transcriptional regulator [Anaerolineales bacterium HSG25]
MSVRTAVSSSSTGIERFSDSAIQQKGRQQFNVIIKYPQSKFSWLGIFVYNTDQRTNYGTKKFLQKGLISVFMLLDNEVLQQVGLFDNLAERDLEVIVSASYPHTIKQNDYALNQGDVATTFFVVMDGRFRIIQLGMSGQQVIFQYVGPGRGIGNLATVQGTHYSASAQAIEDSLLFAWPCEIIQQLLARYPQLATNIQLQLLSQVEQLQNAYRCLATETVEQRTAHALIRLAHQMGRRVEEGILIDFPLSRQEIAEMTGTTLHMVSRILSQWKHNKLVVGGRKQIIIRNLTCLQYIAEDITCRQVIIDHCLTCSLCNRQYR